MKKLITTICLSIFTSLIFSGCGGNIDFAVEKDPSFDLSKAGVIAVLPYVSGASKSVSEDLSDEFSEKLQDEFSNLKIVTAEETRKILGADNIFKDLKPEDFINKSFIENITKKINADAFFQFFVSKVSIDYPRRNVWDNNLKYWRFNVVFKKINAEFTACLYSKKSNKIIFKYVSHMEKEWEDGAWGIDDLIIDKKFGIKGVIKALTEN